tara:strand:- start:14381 stop:15019 length:639 start_codon:yes stop_codon:yes gene_type:complete
MSDAFQHGWALVKMASYKVGPTEFWDGDERDRSWQETSKDGETNYFPMGGSPSFGSYHAKTMMKPQDYLRLTSPVRGFRGNANAYGSTLQDYLWHKKKGLTNTRTDGIMDAMNDGKPTFIPNLQIASLSHDEQTNGELPPKRDVTGHEGRHRMAAILQILGNRPVPTQLSSNYFPDMQRKLILDGSPLRGQFDEEQLLNLDPELMFNVGDVD